MVEPDYAELLEYYVYAYLRKSDNTPYYIGKGSGSRLYSKQHSVTVPKDKSQIQLLAVNLTETAAHLIETMLIEHYGRKDIGTGILRNRTNGGEGSSGKIVSPETRSRISLALKGKKLPPRSQEHCRNISKSLKGKTVGPHSIEHKQRISNSLKNKEKTQKQLENFHETIKKRKESGIKGNKRTINLVTCPHCDTIGGGGNMTRYHFEKCKRKNG